MSFLDFLTSGSTPPQVTTESNTGGQLPLWYSQYMQGLFNKASDVAGEAYQPYGGPRIAGFNPTQQAGFNYAQNTATDWQQPMQQAQDAATRGAAPYDPNQMQNFMSPYTEGVVNQIENQGQRFFDESLMPGLNSNFVGSGQFGSSRHEDMALRGARDVGENVLNQSALARQRGFEAASKDYGDWTNRATTGAGALGKLADQQQQQDTLTGGALTTVGGQMQGMDQANLDLAYQDFLEERGYPMQQTNFMTSVMRGTQPPPTTTSKTETGPYQGGAMGPSPLAQIGQLYGLYRGVNTPP